MYDVLGMGMECSKSKTKWILCKTIFGGYYKSSDITYIKLSRNDCLDMKINKICASKDNGETLKLQCNGDVCSTEEKVFEPLLYSSGWWGVSASETFSCQIVPKFITAIHENDHIFGTDCMPSNLYCYLPRSIIVWNESIIMKCPFRPLKLSVRMKQIINSNNEEILLSHNNEARWAFKIKEKISECGKTLLKTTEGLYLAPVEYYFEKVSSAKMESTLYDDKSEMGIQLASNDYNIIEEKEIENELLMKECQLLKNTIKSFSFHQDKFFKVTDLNNLELILYARHFQIYKPSCQIIETIMLYEKSLKCYEDIPIEFNYTTPDGRITKKINGFLTMNGIIKNIGKEITCTEETTYMKLDNSNISLRKFNNLYKKFNNLNYQHLNVHFKKYETILDHNELLVNGVDYLNQIAEVTKVVEINGLYNVIEPILPMDDIKHFSLANLVGNIIIYASVILLVLFTIYIVYKLIICIICLQKRSKKNKQYNDLKKCVEYIKKNKESSGSIVNNIPEV